MSKVVAFQVERNEVDKIATIFLYGVFGNVFQDVPRIFAQDVLYYIYALSDYDRINIHLNGPGGDVAEMLPIANHIKYSAQEKVHLYNDAVCASSFGFLLASGKDGHRHAAKNSAVMLHKAGSGGFGNANDFRDKADMLDVYDEALAGIIVDATGKTIDEVKALFFDGKDHWLTALEAQEMGIATIEDYDAKPMPENITALSFQQIAAFYNPKTDMSLLFKNPFKSISACASKANADITDEQLSAITEELKSEGVTALSVVKTDDLNETIAEAGKVEGLNTKITALETSVNAEKEKVTALEAKLTALGAKPAAEATGPVALNADGTPATVVAVDNFETSFDREVKAAKS